MANNTNGKPVAEIRVGRIIAAIWQNTPTDEGSGADRAAAGSTAAPGGRDPEPGPSPRTGDAPAVRRGVGPGGPGSRRRGRLGSRRGTRRPDARLEAGRRAGHRRRPRDGLAHWGLWASGMCNTQRLKRSAPPLGSTGCRCCWASRTTRLGRWLDSLKAGCVDHRQIHPGRACHGGPNGCGSCRCMLKLLEGGLGSSPKGLQSF